MQTTYAHNMNKSFLKNMILIKRSQIQRDYKV